MMVKYRRKTSLSTFVAAAEMHQMAAVAAVTSIAPNNSFKPKPLRGSA
jgi:hypothetical protein